MGQTLNQIGPIAHVAEVKHYGEALIVPDGMKIPEAIELLNRRQKYLTESCRVADTFDAFPWDGANALNEVLIRKFKWAPPASGSAHRVEVDFGVFKFVPWGQFEIPGTSAVLMCDAERDSKGRWKFRIAAKCLRMEEETVRALFDEVREYLKTNSIYRGKAIKVRFLDDDGNLLPMPEPKFMDTSKISRDMLVYSESVMDAVETNLFTPIERVQDLILNDMPVKRAVLLGGTYGTGKTLAATVASKIAVDNGITYLYVPRADELSHGIEFLMQYQSPAGVLFCEDIDRVVDGERTVEMDDILNIVDGIDTKTAKFIMVFTTNDMESINPAMIRPGRLDSVIEVTPPDGKAVEKLIRLYAKEALPADADLTMAGEALAGSIPAVVAEVVNRAKLVQIKHTPRGQKITGLSEDAIIEASITMKGQNDLLARLIAKDAEQPPTLDDMFRQMVTESAKGIWTDSFADSYIK